jgi:hypothetical protein
VSGITLSSFQPVGAERQSWLASRYPVEFPERSHPEHRLVETNKREWRRRLAAIAEALAPPRPKQATDGLMLLVEGAYPVSQTLGGPRGPASEIVGAAEAILTGAFAL